MLNANEIIAKHFEGDPANAVRAHAAVQEILRAQADARPVAEWQVRYMGDPRQPGIWSRSNNPDWCERQYKAIGSASNSAGYQVRPLYTHPEASAPGLSDEDRSLIQEASTYIAGMSPWRHKSKYVIGLRAILTRASAATVAEPSIDTVGGLKAQTTITLRQAESLLQFFGGHDAEVAIAKYDGGLIAWCTECPEEGSFWLGKTEIDDELADKGRPQSTQQQAEPGADERAIAYLSPDRKRVHWLLPAPELEPEMAHWVAHWDDLVVRAAQSGQRAGVADGWQLVPKIPTDEMMGATRPGDWPSEVWVKMLAAAPTQQEGGKLDVSFIGGAQPTHYCKMCHAMWRRWPDGSWNLRSKQCGACCDNVAMSDQIVPMGHDGARATDGSAESIANALRPLSNEWDQEPKA